MKSFLAASFLALATATFTMSASSSPAQAGELRDKFVQAAQDARGVLSIARIKGSCLVNKLRGRDGGFLCQ